MNLKKVLLKTWSEVVLIVPKLNEEQCNKALTLLREQDRDTKDLQFRIHRRFTQLRARREREELGIA